MEKLLLDKGEEMQAKGATASRGYPQVQSTVHCPVLRPVSTQADAVQGPAHPSWASVVADLLSLLDSPGSRRLHSPDLARLLLEAVTDPLARAMPGVVGDTQGHQWRAILRSANGLLQEAPQMHVCTGS